MNKLTGFVLALAVLMLPASDYAQAQASITGTVRPWSSHTGHTAQTVGLQWWHWWPDQARQAVVPLYVSG
jgi:hypothetical protein